MSSLFSDHPLLAALFLLFLDMLLWRLIGSRGDYWKLAVRVLIFSLYSLMLFNQGMNPMQAAPWPDACPCTWPPPAWKLAGGCLARGP